MSSYILNIFVLLYQTESETYSPLFHRLEIFHLGRRRKATISSFGFVPNFPLTIDPSVLLLECLHIFLIFLFYCIKLSQIRTLLYFTGSKYFIWVDVGRRQFPLLASFLTFRLPSIRQSSYSNVSIYFKCFCFIVSD